MRIGAARIRPRMLGYTLAFVFIASASLITQGLAADSTSTPSKESFNLILPFKDLTVGQGQEATMDAEVVNRTKDPVEISLQIEGVPAGWDVNFNSRYPSFPIRSVMVQGGDQTTNKSTTLEFKAKVPENTRPGNYPVKVTAKDIKGTTQYVETITYRVTSKKVETGGLKLTSQYPVLSTGSGQTLKFTVDLKNETNKPLTTSLAAKTPPGWNAAFQTAVRRPTDLVDPAKRKRLGDSQCRDRHAGEGGCQRAADYGDRPFRRL